MAALIRSSHQLMATWNRYTLGFKAQQSLQNRKLNVDYLYTKLSPQDDMISIDQTN